MPFSPSPVLSLLAAAALSVLAAGCASNPPIFEDNLVVPGERVGRVQIGMPLSELINVMGVPRASVPIPDTNATSYSFDGLTVGADDQVYWILVDDPRFRTASGVAPGSEHILARAAMGPPACVVTRGDMTTYDYRNIYVDVDSATGHVRRIGVLKKTNFCRS